MKMPEKIDNEMFAPCGMNCQLCSDYCKSNCPGCLISDFGKKKSTLKCKIKSCFDKKAFKYCGRCSEFPCKLIKKHDKNSVKRYDFSTLNNANKIKNTGINRINLENRLDWICPKCEGIITIEDKTCTECGYKIKKD